MHNYVHTVEYASDYLVPGVTLPTGPGFHQITLAWDPRHPELGGSFYIDPNACGLDAFGDRTICTRMAAPESDMKLTLLAEKPGHRAYLIEARRRGSKGDYTPLPLRLVTISAHGIVPARARLLVVDANQAVARIIALHEERPA